MVVELCGHVMEFVSLCGILCLCTLSASALIEPSLHQLDSFKNLEVAWAKSTVAVFIIHAYACKACFSMKQVPHYINTN